VIHQLWNLTGLRKTLRVSSSPLENPLGFPQIPQLRRRRAILGVHLFGAGPFLSCSTLYTNFSRGQCLIHVGTEGS